MRSARSLNRLAGWLSRRYSAQPAFVEEVTLEAGADRPRGSGDWTGGGRAR